jgi:hypothetical protein
MPHRNLLIGVLATALLVLTRASFFGNAFPQDPGSEKSR